MSHRLAACMQRVYDITTTFRKEYRYGSMALVLALAFFLGVSVATDTFDKRNGVRQTLQSLEAEQARKSALLVGLNAEIAEKVALAQQRSAELEAHEQRLRQLENFDETEKAMLAKLAVLQESLLVTGIDIKEPGQAFGDSWSVETEKGKESLAVSIFPDARKVCYMAWYRDSKIQDNLGNGKLCLPISSLDSVYADRLMAHIEGAFEGADEMLMVKPIFRVYHGDGANTPGVNGYFEIIDLNTGVIINHNIFVSSQLDISRFSQLPANIRSIYEGLREQALKKTAK